MRFYAILLIVTSLVPLPLFAQVETQSEVIERIDLGLKYLSEKEHTKSIELLLSAKEVALQQQWYPQAFNATLNMGTNYYLMLDYGEALQYYLQAYEIAINHLGPRQEMVIFNNIGVLYIEEKDPAKAEESFLKAYAIAKKINDQEQIGACAVNLALLSNETGKITLAQSYIEEAVPLLKKKKNVLLLAQIAKAENLYLRNKLEQAKQLALRILPQLDNLSVMAKGATVNDKSTLLLILSKIYNQQNQFNQAIRYALRARSEAPAMEARMEVYQSLSHLYERSDNLPIAMAYKDSMLLASEALHTVKNGALFKSEKVKFQIQNYKQEVIASKQALAQEKQFFYKLIIGVLLVTGFLVWLYKNNALKHKQRKKIVELELAKEKSDHQILEQQQQQKEALALLEQERLTSELERKNRELTAKALFQASKNELIEEVVTSMATNTKIANDIRLKTQLKDLKTHLKKDTQWDSFFAHFEALNRGFLDRLMAKHTKLTANDIRFLSFVYMNLSNKEIASLLNITSQSCRKRKERISKKMNVPKTLTLQAYLSTV